MSKKQMDEIQNILQDMNEQYDTSNQMIANNNESLNEEDIGDINQYLVNEDSQGEADGQVAAGGDLSLLESENNAQYRTQPSARNTAGLKSPMKSEASSRQVYPGQQKSRKFQTYTNMDEDPSLMLENDEENA